MVLNFGNANVKVLDFCRANVTQRFSKVHQIRKYRIFRNKGHFGNPQSEIFH